MCVCVCSYVEPVSRSKGLCPVSNKNWFCRMPVHTCVTECVWNEGIYIPLGEGGSFFEDLCILFTRVPGRGIVGLCCCVPCLSSAIISLCLLILHRRSRPHSVSDHCSHLFQCPIGISAWACPLSFLYNSSFYCNTKALRPSTLIS